MKYIYTLLIMSFAFVLSSVTDSARSQSLLSVFGDWAAYTITEQNSKNCYIRSEPTRSEPNRLNHGEVHFFVSIYPDQGIKGQPYFQVGYSFQENSSVSIDVAGKTFNMFTQEDGAWIHDDSVEPVLVQSMIEGNTMTVSGVSGRGNKTTYRFSLKGVTKAIEEARKACS